MDVLRRTARLGALALASAAALLVLTHCTSAQESPPSAGQHGPYATAFLTITVTNPATGSELAADVHFPTGAAGLASPAKPMPVLVYVPGTSTPRGSYSGNAQHLATWGYVVALPGMPQNDLAMRASDVQRLLQLLERLSSDRSFELYGVMDLSRVGLAGHSLGGITPLMLAARSEPSLMAALALDPVNPDGNEWDHENEGYRIDVPVAIIGAPPHVCNWFARYREMYAHLGTGHRAMYVIRDGGHCDFLDPGVRLAATVCGFICGGYSEQRLALIERYSAAWHNYYIRLDTDAYGVLYGERGDADVAAGLVERLVYTAPRNVIAQGRACSVELRWRAFNHPIIAGYNIYRSEQSGVYSELPYAKLEPQSSFVDHAVVPGREYFYVITSRDATGNEHQRSLQVSATADPATAKIESPMLGMWPASCCPRRPVKGLQPTGLQGLGDQPQLVAASAGGHLTGPATSS